MLLSRIFHSLLCAMPVQYGYTALHYAAAKGRMTIVKFLVDKCHAVIATQDKDGQTPISDAVMYYADIADYLTAQVKARIIMKRTKMIMETNMLPFHTGVRTIIVKYLL